MTRKSTTMASICLAGVCALGAVTAATSVTALTGCNTNPAKPELKEVRLGTTDLVINIPKDSQKGKPSKNQAEDYMMEYYAYGDTDFCLDVYQWAVTHEATFEQVVQAEMSDYENAKDMEKTKINDIEVAYFYATDVYKHTEYEVLNFVAEDGNDYYVMLTFWLEGKTAKTDAWEYIQTLAIKPVESNVEKGKILIGNSGLSLYSDAVYQKVALNIQDIYEHVTDYYQNMELGVEFYVFQFGKGEGVDLLTFTKNDSAVYGNNAPVEKMTVGGMEFAFYNATDVNKAGNVYETYTYITETDDMFVGMEFFLCNASAGDVVKALMNTVKK